MTTSSFRAMAINAFFLGLRMANRWNLSLKNDPFIRQAAHEACTKIERRYLLPLVIAVLLYLPALSSFLGRNPDRKSTRLNSSHVRISYAVFCLKKKK